MDIKDKKEPLNSEQISYIGYGKEIFYLNGVLHTAANHAKVKEKALEEARKSFL